jgi:hypothetical protein
MTRRFRCFGPGSSGPFVLWPAMIGFSHRLREGVGLGLVALPGPLDEAVLLLAVPRVSRV